MGLLRRIKSFVISNESERSSEAFTSFTRFLRRPSVILSSAKNPSTLAIIFSSLFIAFLGIIIFRNQLSTFFAGSAGADPVAYWKFDEGQGSTAYDSTGSNNGTLGSGNSAPTWVSSDLCVSGKCLRFDGTNDYVEVVSSSSISPTSAITMQAWIKVTGACVTDCIIFNKENDYEWRVLNGTIDYAIRNTSPGWNWVSTGMTVLQNEWVHIAFTYDSSSQVIYAYKNGSLSYTRASSTGSIGTTGSGLRIGARGAPTTATSLFPGYIDEVKIYNYARSAAQIKADYASRGSTKGVSAQFGNDNLSRKLTDGLVGYWKMDEAVGSTGSAWTVLDSSGNNNTGIGATTAGTGVGKFGNGGSFDGSGFVSVTQSPAISNASFSVAGWVYASSLSADSVWFSMGNSGQVNEMIHLRMDPAGGIRFGFYGNDLDTPVGTFTTGTWHHVVYTYDVGSGVRRIYFNSLMKAEDIASASYTGNSATYIGSFGGGERWNGRIDEVRIYNRALDAGEVKSLYEFAPGPVGWWKMDENAGTTAYDSAGVGITGTITLSPIWTSGKYGNSLQFDGTTNQRVDMGNSTTLEMGSADMTLEAWVKLSTANNGQTLTLVEKGATATTTEGYWLYHLDTNVLGFRLSDGSSRLTATGTSTISDNNWHHVSAVVDRDGNASVYVDGVMEGSTDISSFNGVDITNASRTFRVGSSSGSGSVIGKIDQVQLYSYARTPSQVIEDMNAGHPAIGTPVGSTVLHLKMDEGYGSTVNDSSPQNNDGTLATGSSAPTWTNDGKYGKALSFDGTNDYLQVQNGADLFSGVSEVTVSLWVKHNDSNILRSIINLPTFAGDPFSIENNGANSPAKIYFNNNNPVDIPLTVSEWTHLVAVFDDGIVYGYKNGKLIGQATNDEVVLRTVTGDLVFGRMSWVSGFTNMNLDDVRIYPFALSVDQVKTVYNQGEQIVLGSTSTGVGGTSPSNSASRVNCIPGDSSTCNAPVGEWNFEEGVGGTANDTSGNANVGNFGAGNSAPSWASGKVGKALKFDGTDIVNVGDPAGGELDFGTNDFTLEAWVKTSASTEYIGILSKRTINIGYQMYIEASTNSLSAFIGDAGGYTFGASSGINLRDGKWHHVSTVFDRDGNVIYYVDGKQDGTPRAISTRNGSIDTSADLQIAGTYQSSTRYIDQVRIYNYARTPAQIAWEYNKGAPVAWYKMDECSGTVIKDWAPNSNGGFNGNTGTLTVGATGTQTSAGSCSSGISTEAWNNGTTGKREASLSFDGTDDYVDAGTMASINNGISTLTVSAWVKPTTLANLKAVVYRDDPAAGVGGWAMGTAISDSNDVIVAVTGTAYGQSSGNFFTAGTWGHWTMVFDGTQPDNPTRMKFYFNGIQQKLNFTGTIPTTSVTSPVNVTIGSRSGGTRYFNGQIDDVKIFNYALTPAQIKLEMNGGAVRFE